MISVLIMIFGVTLFLRLAQVLFRPDKVRFSCPAAGWSGTTATPCMQSVRKPHQHSDEGAT
jgi:voltage-gated potassium channel